ncbi:hypothetical protein [Amycolatopsis sp. NPDC049868]|uniref:hypothetical protein n=1 Tax=Amycolatopsis sp. NPDC049868 TaxID=3363934 RepID=UPI0037978773
MQFHDSIATSATQNLQPSCGVDLYMPTHVIDNHDRATSSVGHRYSQPPEALGRMFEEEVPHLAIGRGSATRCGFGRGAQLAPRGLRPATGFASNVAAPLSAFVHIHSFGMSTHVYVRAQAEVEQRLHADAKTLTCPYPTGKTPDLLEMLFPIDLAADCRLHRLSTPDKLVTLVGRFPLLNYRSSRLEFQ